MIFGTVKRLGLKFMGPRAQFVFLILILFMGQMISMAQFGIAHARESRWEFQPRPTDRPAEWCIAEERHGFNENSRGLGLLDLSYAVKEGRAPRASGDLAQHVLDAMLGILESPDSGGYVDIQSSCDRPTPLPENFAEEL